jgi:hypothetical protein
MKGQSKLSGVKFVDGFRALMRPLITIYLLGLATFIAINISAIIGGLESIPVGSLVEMYISIISDILFLTLTAVTWWFASRAHHRNKT